MGGANDRIGRESRAETSVAAILKHRGIIPPFDLLPLFDGSIAVLSFFPRKERRMPPRATGSHKGKRVVISVSSSSDSDRGEDDDDSDDEDYVNDDVDDVEEEEDGEEDDEEGESEVGEEESIRFSRLPFGFDSISYHSAVTFSRFVYDVYLCF